MQDTKLHYEVKLANYAQTHTRPQRNAAAAMQKWAISQQMMDTNGIGWRCRESNPVPLACKASALPYELHPL